MATTELDLGNVTGGPGAPGASVSVKSVQRDTSTTPPRTVVTLTDGTTETTLVIVDGETPTEADIRAAFGAINPKQTISANTALSCAPNNIYEVESTGAFTLAVSADATATWADGDWFFVFVSGTDNENPPTVAVTGGSIVVKGVLAASSATFIHCLYLHGQWLYAVN